MEILNNLVTELANITEFPKKSYSEWMFMNPREGWVFISSTASAEGSDRTHISLGAVPSDMDLLVHQSTAPDTLEAMRYLPAGEHKPFSGQREATENLIPSHRKSGTCVKDNCTR